MPDLVQSHNLELRRYRRGRAEAERIHTRGEPELKGYVWAECEGMG